MSVPTEMSMMDMLHKHYNKNQENNEAHNFIEKGKKFIHGY